MIKLLRYWMFVVSVFCAALSYSHSVWAAAIDCFSGDIITREIASIEGKSLSFSFSSDCDRSKKHTKEKGKEKPLYLTLNVKILSSETDAITGEREKKMASEVKAILTLRAAATPIMLYSLSDTLRKKSNYSRDYLSYKIYKRMVKGVEHEPIFHKENKNFYVECTKQYCMVVGVDVDHLISYRFQIFDSTFRDWLLMHELVTEFVEESYHHDNHEKIKSMEETNLRR